MKPDMERIDTGGTHLDELISDLARETAEFCEQMREERRAFRKEMEALAARFQSALSIESR